MAGQHLDKVTQGKSAHKKTDSQPEPEHQHRPFRLEDADVMDLQRHLGNQATQNVLGIQRKPAGLPSLPGVIQTKMNVNEPGDQYEQEADAVAHEVMTMPDPVQRASELEEEEMLQGKHISDIQRESPEEEEMMMKRDPDIQREAPEEEEMMMKRDPDIQREAPEEEMMMKRDPDIQREAPEEEEMMMKRISDIQRDGGVSVPQVTDEMEGQINSAKGGGQAIPEETRSFLEPRFGQDFSDVRIHTGGEADTLNNNLQAKAFTTGSDIFFRDGDYNPNSSDGRELLAHELTHVVQQGGSKDLKTKHDDECC
jgi:hypothetical protein